MSTDKNTDPAKDTAKPEKEGSISNDTNKGAVHITGLPVKDDMARNETEGERRFKEGMANNSDTGQGNPS